MLLATLNLGAGHRAALVWRSGTDRSAGIPMGLIEMHGECRTYLTWVEQHDPWRLVSLRPLTVSGLLACPSCGMMGTLTDGRYVQVAPLATEGAT